MTATADGGRLATARSSRTAARSPAQRATEQGKRLERPSPVPGVQRNRTAGHRPSPAILPVLPWPGVRRRRQRTSSRTTTAAHDSNAPRMGGTSRTNPHRLPRVLRSPGGREPGRNRRADRVHGRDAVPGLLKARRRGPPGPTAPVRKARVRADPEKTGHRAQTAPPGNKGEPVPAGETARAATGRAPPEPPEAVPAVREPPRRQRRGSPGPRSAATPRGS